YRGEAVFREAVDRCAELLKPHLHLDLREVLYPANDSEAAARLQQTALAQPALFVIGYALARLWQSWGITPSALLGHSLGEYVAACLAGVFTLEDALALVAARGRLMQALPAGAMLSVPLGEAELIPLLNPALSLAAVNAADACVVSGPLAAIDDFAQTLKAQGIEGVRLRTSHAFHSAMLEPVLGVFAEQVAQIALKPPQIPYLSNLTGGWITPEQAVDPHYWTRHLRQTVRFADNVQALRDSGDWLLLEAGPGALAGLVRQVPLLASLPHPRQPQDDQAAALAALGRLWLAGAAVDWEAFHGGGRRRLPLPTYPFQRQRFWIEATPAIERPRPRRDPAQWFHVPVWQRAIAPVHRPGAPLPQTGWLLFADDCGLGAQLAQRLAAAGQTAITVVQGCGFARLDDGGYALNPARDEDYGALFDDLARRGPLPRTLVHLWSVTWDDLSEAADLCQKTQAAGFYSLLAIARALWRLSPADEIRIEVVSNHVQAVTGDECLIPEKATVLGPVRVIPQEHPNLRCRSIDVTLDDGLADRLLAELAFDGGDPAPVALRGPCRWTQGFAARRLDPPAGPAQGLRKHGVYLITGGLGGIGLILAEHLARTVQARLILVCRSALSPAEHRRQTTALEALGAEVMVAGADVADPVRMQAVLAQAVARFGAVHGVIHAAGVAAGGAIQVSAATAAAQELAAKVEGTRTLAALYDGAGL
ncbi:MAG: SDR family NAD(P)-dependent oxidoreductase, partial [Pseudomonadota bacterium]|nr:SDR family NAD(P)-dependent oxidoreductase [Pseudomonadota bacterium]